MTENYHTHTARCRHAVGIDEEYVGCAIDKGLQILGFSDHTPFLFPGDYYSRMRMYPEELADYVASIRGLQAKYAEKIDIRLGLEVEYYPNRIADLLELIAPYGIEYMILGQHWCGDEQDSPYNGHETDDEMHLARYCEQVIEAMHTGLFSYFAHPDLLFFTGPDDLYRHHFRKVCQAAKQLNFPLEINLLGLRSQRHYPNRLFWEIAGEEGCAAVLGADAHSPETVTDPQSEKTAIEIARAYDLNLLTHVPIRPYTRSGLLK